MKFDPSLFD